MASRVKIEFFLTGFWLGASQIALTFHLLYSQGASIVYYFGLIFLWLLCSVLAIQFVHSDKYGDILKIASLLSFCITAYITRVEPFTFVSLFVLLVAVVLVGMFSGFFFKKSVEQYKKVSLFLLYENNGFILGYALGGCLLFFSIMLVDLVSVLAGLTVFATGLINRKIYERN